MRRRFVSGTRRVPVLREYAHGLGAVTEPLDTDLYCEVQSDQAWVEVPLDSEWTAAYRLADQRGTPVIAELRVFPRPPDDPSAFPGPEMARPPGCWEVDVLASGAVVPKGGVSARLLRKVRVGEHYAFAAEWRRRDRVVDELLALPDTEVTTTTLMPESEVQGLLRTRGEVRDRRTAALDQDRGRVGRPSRPDAFYAQWAARYDRLMREHHPRPVAALAGRHGIPRSQVRDHIRRARQLGLLTPALHQGQKAGTLTARGEELAARESYRSRKQKDAGGRCRCS